MIISRMKEYGVLIKMHNGHPEGMRRAGKHKDERYHLVEFHFANSNILPIQKISYFCFGQCFIRDEPILYKPCYHDPLLHRSLSRIVQLF